MMCSVIGVPDLVSSRSLMARLMWFISILMSVAFTFYLIMSSILAYYNYDVVTNIKVVYLSQIDYPAVSFCPFGINNEENMFLIDIDRFLMYADIPFHTLPGGGTVPPLTSL